MTGANFKLKAKNVAGYRNYDSSEFTATSPLLDDDDALEALWKKENSLAELVASDQFKSYDELKKRLGYVLGNKAARPVVDEELEDESEGRGNAEQVVAAATTTPKSSTGTGANYGEEEDDALSYFAQLAQE